MSLKGYSLSLLKANQAANQKSIGVQLGKYCIGNDIPVVDVAETFGVSRQTVYSWFIGQHEPQAEMAEIISNWLKGQLSRRTEKGVTPRPPATLSLCGMG